MTLFSFRQGKKDKKNAKDKRIHRPTVVTDDSGSIGDSEPYTKVTSVVRDPENFGKIKKEFPRVKNEVKYHNSNHEVRTRILMRVAECDIDIYEKTYHPSELKLKTKRQRKEHYFKHTRKILNQAFESKTNKVIDIIFDNDMISEEDQQRFVDMCIEIARAYGKEIYWVEMVDSQTSPIVGVHDFITGAVGGHIRHKNNPEHESHELYKIIESKIVK